MLGRWRPPGLTGRGREVLLVGRDLSLGLSEKAHLCENGYVRRPAFLSSLNGRPSLSLS